jgi:hypothetical protein
MATVALLIEMLIEHPKHMANRSRLTLRSSEQRGTRQRPVRQLSDLAKAPNPSSRSLEPAACVQPASIPFHTTPHHYCY